MNDSERPSASLELTAAGVRVTAGPDHPIVIGREAGCDLTVAHRLLSRRHVEVSWTGGTWIVRDLGSSNGTYRDGQRVEVARLTEGTVLRLGAANEDGLEVRVGVAPVTAPPDQAGSAVPARVEAAGPDPVTRPVPPTGPGSLSGERAVQQASDAYPMTRPVKRTTAPGPTTQPVARETADPATRPVKRTPTPAPTPPPAAATPVAATPAATTPAAATAAATTPAATTPAAARPAAAEAAARARGVASVTGRVATAAHPTSGLIRIGRDEDNDIVLRQLTVSRHHAEIRPGPDGLEAVDLGSRNGTFVNGRAVTRERLREGDRVSVGRHQFIVEGQRLREFVDNGPVTLVADDLTVQIGKATLLDDVSFALPNGSLLAVIGPSGCGKSTLLRAMTGLRPATTGRVRYDGRDLYADYAELRYRIGLVPQDDVLHRQLTVRRALRYSAALRFADDVPRKQRWARVDEVLGTLGLSERARQRIDTLSGGQRKRTSVALELLTEPSLLYLDEPTSGLDPSLDKEVMTELREIADSGRTVVVVTHSVLNLDLCDRVLVMCQGGTMGYFGPPDELLDFFGASDYAEIFKEITENPKHWTRRYRGSEVYREYVLDVIDKEEPPAVPAPGGPKPQMAAVPLTSRAIHPAAPVRQFVTLCARMLSVVGSDRGYSLFLLGLPLALALITRTVPGHEGLGRPAEPFSLEAQRLLVVLAVGAAFLGIATAIREIVNEAPIYRRERAVGLSPTAYLASKLAVFAVIDSIQVVLFVWLALLGRPEPKESLVVHPPLAEIMVAVALVALASTALGLLVSSLVKTTEQTTPVLVVSVMAQLVLSGGLFELTGQAVLEQIAWLSPTRWGFAAGAGTVDLRPMVQIDDPLWTHAAWSWWRAILLLCVQILVLSGFARLALRRHEPGHS